MQDALWKHVWKVSLRTELKNKCKSVILRDVEFEICLNFIEHQDRMSRPGPSGRKSSVQPSGSKPKTPKQPSPRGAGRGALVPRGNRPAAIPMGKEGTMLAPKGYTLRPVQEAKNYDVISFARAMNDDFGPRVKKLFDPEREAALDAQETGIYIGWRCPEFKHDCQRINRNSKCFCGHLLKEHASYNGRSVNVPCKQFGCACKAYAWIPSRPEDIGEFWFQRRRGFDVTTWRAKCRCKHTHEEHKPTGYRQCLVGGCKCGMFDSNFLCAACDRHWEEHETFFEDTDTRRQNGLPIGADYLPFAEIPSLRNMVLTGEDDGDMSYMSVMQSPYAQPLPMNQPADNSTAVTFGRGGPQRALEGAPRGQFPALGPPGGTPMGQFPPGRGQGRGGSGGPSGSGFRPVYD
ncbi:hypothetical protein LSAT2_006907 [Lamellibrachia satsuma]|nr:hypothetical protein LSAT2_006907 [Lamellibrachia satsuma]